MNIIIRNLVPALLLICFVLEVGAESYEDGREAYIKGDYQRAYEILHPLAKGGNSDAQKMLGIMYDYGHGVEADPQKALEWYTQSAKQGDPAVQYQVGAKYFRGDDIKQDFQQAAKWWELASNGGQVDAQFNLGLMYFRGLAVSQNDAKAAELFRAAAEQGHGQAQYSLAVMYAFGRGVEKNYTTALRWFEQSAKQGVAQAQFNLGVFYENGYGVEKNLGMAAEWYERAAAQGLAEAGIKLAALDTPAPTDSQEVTTSAAAPVKDIEQTEPVAEDVSSGIAPDGIKREDWVLRQPSEYYTIQIGSVIDEEKLLNFIRANDMENDTAYIEVMIDGVTRYNALFGTFSSHADATRAINDLPDPVKRVNPWVRNFGILHKLIQNNR